MLALSSAAPAAPQPPGAADADIYDRHAALALSQGAIGNVLGAHRFASADGRSLTLASLRGRPLVISLIYTSCSHTCPLITQSLARAVASARDAFGAGSFTVLTVGFDAANDTPERMRAYARGQRIDDPHWHFLSADAGTIRRLADELGFIFFPSPRGYDHLAQVSVVDDGLRVYSQIYGDDFNTPALAEPLRRLALGLAAERGGVAGLFERLRLFCTVYDAASGRYRLDYTLIIAFVTGAMCMLAIGVFVMRAWQQHRQSDVSA